MAQHAADDRATPIGAIFGANRSGTTWLGSIVDSHPRVAYRFEPFHRLKRHPRIAAARRAIEGDELSDATLTEVYDALLPAHPLLDKPPYFHKANARRGGKIAINAAARKLPWLAGPAERWYTPRDRPPLVFKEVGLVAVLTRLAERTSMPIVYLVRHPAAVAASMTEGQRRGLMPAGRLGVLTTLMRDHAPRLAERFAHRVDELSPLAQNALLWRFEIEQVWPVVKRTEVMTVIYEDLCVNPLDRARDVLAHFGLETTAQTTRFVEVSTRKDDSVGREDWMVDAYFSVYRDPAESMNRWKQELKPDDRHAIDAVLDGCEPYEELRERGQWS